jgi:Fur family transcriptional regulator, zinc uptake regulator
MSEAYELTRNQTLVLEKLAETEQPKSAYTLLDELRGSGFKAPLQVYRALDKLVAQGRVHRLESISAFVACQDPACETHAATVFLICEKCGKVSERADAGLAKALKGVAKADGFGVTKTSIELRGVCGNC